MLWHVNLRMTGSALPLPPLIRDAFELLAREEEDALIELAAIRTLRGWLGEREPAGLAAARAQDCSWEEIGQAQGRPRQAVERQARQAQRPRVLGLTAPDADMTSAPAGAIVATENAEATISRGRARCQTPPTAGAAPALSVALPTKRDIATQDRASWFGSGHVLITDGSPD